MQNKLQELTEKLYSEGLSKGKHEAEEMKIKAKKEAEEIISQAKEESKQIISNAHKEAEDIKIKLLNEVKMASKQSLSSLKKQIETVIINKSTEQPIAEALGNSEFLKTIIQSAVSAFNPDSSFSRDLKILLPDSLQKELDSFIKNEIQKQFKGVLEVKFDKRMTSGFKIGPKGENYYISFTDKDFQELLGSYLRPKTREFLFSE
ncbi:MAG: hypothetical protein ABFC28_08685 [Rikenellaceae bacterium]